MSQSRRGASIAAVIALVVALGCPGAALAGNGKKAFKKGVEFEEAQRWDQAAEQFALAIVDDPANSEYRLHYYRAIANASIMLTQRGDRLAEQKDYAAAYQAYRQAYSYDATNELAGEKMRYMLKLQGMEPEPEGPEKDLVRAKYDRSPDATIQIPPSKRVLTDVVYHGTPLRQIIDSLSESLGLNVIYDSDFKDDTKKVDFELRNVTRAKALEMLLFTNKLFYVQADTRTIIIAPDQPQNRARYQNLSVKTFYLRNADAQEVRTLIQQVVATKYLVANKQQNSLTVRDTPANLELIQSIIASIDKDRAEVLIEVNLYEVDHTDLLQIGNQFTNTSTADSNGNKAPAISENFGGVGQAAVLRAASPVGAFGPIGLALALPTSTLTAFQSKTNTKLLAATQVHVLDNEQHTIRIGSRVPIRTASFVGTGTTIVADPNNRNPNNPNNFNNLGVGTPATQFQYENVGLNIDLQPVVHEDMVQIKMKIETSDVGAPGVGGNPTFTQRNMSSVASIRNGQTTLIAGVAQQNESNGREGIAFLSLLPGIGRLFATPKKDNRVTDVVITVTPHILRAPVYTQQDNLSIPAGTSTAPDRQVSIEEILYRAELDEAAAASPPIATSAPPAAAPATPAAARPTTTNVEFTVPGAPDGGTTRPVRTGPGEVINTPGGSAHAPVVAPDEQAPRPVAPLAKPQPVAPDPADDEDDDDEGDDDDDGGPTGAKAPGVVDVRLTGLQVSSLNKPMPVAVWAAGGAKLTSATIAIKFDERLLRVNKVESTGMFDGKLGAKIPFEVHDGMLVVTLTRPPEMANQPVSGQLMNVTFDVLGSGTVSLAVVPSASRLVGLENAIAEVRSASSLVVTTR
jgi:general secretion pathway protein D